MKQKGEMVPGKRYRGYGYINEFKEFSFEPENTGSRAGVIKAVTQRDGVNVSHSRSFILLRLKVPKSTNKMEVIQTVMRKVNTIIKILKEYDL